MAKTNVITRKYIYIAQRSHLTPLFCRYDREITSTGILLLHSISGGKLRRTLLRALQEHLLQELGGQDTLKNVTLVTTVWDQMPEATMPEHEAHHSVQISIRYADNIVTLYHLRRPSGRPADYT